VKIKFLVVILSVITILGCTKQPVNLPEPKSTYVNKTEIHEIITEGVKLHDSGDFDHAIQKFKKALSLDPDNETALYEITNTLITSGKYEASKTYIKQGIALKGRLLNAFYLLKANSLDIQGKSKEAIKFYKKAEKLNDTDYLIPFNMGITYSRLSDFEKAMSSFERALTLKPTHSSSNLFIAQLFENNNEKVKALLAYVRFCSLETDTPRYNFAVTRIQKILNKGVTKTGENSISINVADLLNSKNDIYSKMRTYLTMSGALRIGEKDEAKGLTNFDLLAKQFKDLLKYFEEISEKEEPNDFFWKTYSPYFLALSKNNFTKPFSVILFNNGEKKNANKWANDHSLEMQSFSKWNNMFNENY